MPQAAADVRHREGDRGGRREPLGGAPCAASGLRQPKRGDHSDDQEHEDRQSHGQYVAQQPAVKQLPRKRNGGVTRDFQMRAEQQNHDHGEYRDQDLRGGEAPAGDRVATDDQRQRRADVDPALGDVSPEKPAETAAK